jgi:protein-disulfide isomerase
MKDRVLGDADAPVTVIEYASMTCMHCAEFHNAVLPTLKKDLIDTGKVRFVFREFPLDAVALRASMMARCAPEDKFSGLIEVLFANQKRWVGADDPIAAMSKLGKLTGLSEERINACLGNSELETAILKSRQDAAANYKVNATPTFVFNGGAEVESGVIPADDFKKIVEKLSR